MTGLKPQGLQRHAGDHALTCHSDPRSSASRIRPDHGFPGPNHVFRETTRGKAGLAVRRPPPLLTRARSVRPRASAHHVTSGFNLSAESGGCRNSSPTDVAEEEVRRGRIFFWGKIFLVDRYSVFWCRARGPCKVSDFFLVVFGCVGEVSNRGEVGGGAFFSGESPWGKRASLGAHTGSRAITPRSRAQTAFVICVCVATTHRMCSNSSFSTFGVSIEV